MNDLNEIINSISRKKEIDIKKILELDLDENDYLQVISELKSKRIKIVEKQDEQEEYNYDAAFATVDSTDIYFREIAKYKVLTPEEEKDLAKKVKLGDEEARNKFIESNLKLVISVAKSYLHQGLPVLDVIEEGNLGLITAVERFDPELGYKFSTYAIWWIRQSIMRGIQEKSRVVKISVGANELYSKIKRYNNKIYLEKGREATTEELSLALNIREEKIKQLKTSFQDVISLDSKVNEEEEDTTIADFIADPSSMEEIIVENLEKESIKNILNYLNEREKTILLMRFGFVNDKIYTLEEIGKKLGITRERVRQLEIKILKKIRRGIVKNDYGCYMDCKRFRR